MISSLQGKLSLIENDYLVVEVGGIGYQVYVTDLTRTAQRRGESLSLFTHLVVREDALTLYGFSTRDEVKLFELLLKVNGVGPRLALETLSTHSPDVIRRAVVNKADGVFSQVSGIGKKTAQKIILTLEDRVSVEVGPETTRDISALDIEIQEALVALGYSVVEAQTAIQSIPDEVEEDLESQLTAALRYFS
jgi:Holliday junction DNA helicase RuvA